MILHTTSSLVNALKAAAEPTRLRILALLRTGPLTVKDLTRILGQSQPRLSRHLKLLAEAGLIERAPEGSWAYFHLAQDGRSEGVAAQLLACARPGRSRADARSRARRWRQARARGGSAILLRQARRRVGHDPRAARRRNRGRGGAVGGAWRNARRRPAGRSRHRHRPRARTACRPLSARARLRPVAGHAGVRAQQARTGRHLAMPRCARATSSMCRWPIARPASSCCTRSCTFWPIRHARLQEAARILAPGGKLLIVDFAPHDLEFCARPMPTSGLALPTRRCASGSAIAA